MGERISYSIFALSFETAQEFLRTSNIKKAIYCHTLNTVLFPDSPYAFLRLSMGYALLGDQSKMLLNLKIAFEKGFNNKEYILNSKEFLKYLNTTEFKKALESI